MQMNLTAIYISKSENDLKMSDLPNIFELPKWLMVSEASTKYYKSVTLAKTVQQQVLLQLIMVYTIVYFIRQPL